MEDQELLELAAKAGGNEFPRTVLTSENSYVGRGWNPLADDGDALRLAASLRLVVHVLDDGSGVSAAKTAPDGDDPSDDSGAWFWAASNGDIAAAARYAIVGAAAKIGSAMP